MLEAIEEEGDLIIKEEFLMFILQGIMDEIPPFEKYWIHMFQNKSTPVVRECQSKVLKLDRLGNEIFSPEDNKNKETYTTIGEMDIAADNALLAEIWYKKSYGGASVKC